MLGRVENYSQIEPYSCGAAALKAVMQHWGTRIDERKLIKLVGVDPKSGSSAQQVAAAGQKLGFDATPVSFDSIDELATYTARDIPVIVAIQSFTRPNQGHFVIATDVDDDFVYVMDPNVKGNRRTLARPEMDKRWRFRDRIGVIVTQRNGRPGTFGRARLNDTPSSKLNWMLILGAVAVAAAATTTVLLVRRRRAVAAG